MLLYKSFHIGKFTNSNAIKVLDTLVFEMSDENTSFLEGEVELLSADPVAFCKDEVGRRVGHGES